MIVVVMPHGELQGFTDLDEAVAYSKTRAAGTSPVRVLIQQEHGDPGVFHTHGQWIDGEWKEGGN